MIILPVNLDSQYRFHKSAIDRSIKGVINETTFIKGKYAKKFEENYEKAYGVQHCVSFANGTDAI